MTSRRLTARGAATRDRIVAAAADLMHVKGVNATALDDVRPMEIALDLALDHIKSSLTE